MRLQILHTNLRCREIIDQQLERTLVSDSATPASPPACRLQPERSYRWRP